MWVVKLLVMLAFSIVGASIGTGIGSLWDKQSDDVFADMPSSVGFVVGAVLAQVIYILA